MKQVLVAALAVLLVGRSSAQENASARQPAASNTVESSTNASETYILRGKVVAIDGTAIGGATVSLNETKTATDADGDFLLQTPAGNQQVSISADGYAPLSLSVFLKEDTDVRLELQPVAVTAVTAEPNREPADSSEQIYDADELIRTLPGEPGVPVRLPGLPAETASGGVKAPQYFAPGVAGDHGEPIAQYIQVGGFQFPNNLPANAHGNGYADPNLLIPNTIGFVESDAGAFDVRHGNNAVDLAVGYGLVPRLEPFLQVSADSHDYDFVLGASPKNEQTAGWLALEVAGGNGFLNFPEHRHQYKVNGERSYIFGRHTLTLFGAGYYGQSRIPGLIPVDAQVPGDTIDPRQFDRTHTEVLVASDTWQINNRQELQFSVYSRTYGLNLKSDFGDGLIRQSEFRTVTGGNVSYNEPINSQVSVSSGLDFRRDAPHNAELAHADSNGIFHPITRNDFVISDLAPYASIYGSLSRVLDYSLGVRRDEISFNNTDLLLPGNSRHDHAGMTLPRGTVALHLPPKLLPVIAFSVGQAFHTNDPRIGLGAEHGTPVATSHANQLVITESAFATQFRLALARVSNSLEFAKIDADTGLQQNVGPSRIRSITFSVRHRFTFAALQATFARADAADLLTMQPVPEAPRALYDFSATSIRLPWRIQASGGIEYVGIKPLGDGFNAAPVREIRGAFARSFNNGIDAGIHFLAASGDTGQTLEKLQLPDESSPLERVVGVRQTSYLGVTLSYNFHRR